MIGPAAHGRSMSGCKCDAFSTSLGIDSRRARRLLEIPLGHAHHEARSSNLGLPSTRGRDAGRALANTSRQTDRRVGRVAASQPKRRPSMNIYVVAGKAFAVDYDDDVYDKDTPIPVALFFTGVKAASTPDDGERNKCDPIVKKRKGSRRYMTTRSPSRKPPAQRRARGGGGVDTGQTSGSTKGKKEVGGRQSPRPQRYTRARSTSPRKKPGADVPLSRERMRQLVRCQEGDAKALRERYGLDGVTYSSRLTKSETEALHEYLMDNGVLSPSDVLTYGAMKTASDILCRWPRPSELAQLLVRYQRNADVSVDFTYYTGVFGVTGRNIGGFVGKLGERFIHLMKQYDLMYVWLSSRSRKQPAPNGNDTVGGIPPPKFVMIYGDDRDVVIDAMRDLAAQARELPGVDLYDDVGVLVPRSLLNESDYGDDEKSFREFRDDVGSEPVALNADAVENDRPEAGVDDVGLLTAMEGSENKFISGVARSSLNPNAKEFVPEYAKKRPSLNPYAKIFVPDAVARASQQQQQRRSQTPRTSRRDTGSKRRHRTR